MLVGSHGVGKNSLVEGLAVRIADGNVPSAFTDRRIVQFGYSIFFNPFRLLN